MATDSDKVIDPVCGMAVAPQQNALVYQGGYFAFCSEQCKTRFLANPHLYLAKEEERAVQPAAGGLLKRRHLHLEKPLTPSAAQHVAEELLAMRGVYAVDVAGDEVTITYDLCQVTAEQIEDALLQVGAQLGRGAGERLRRAFVDYLEETEVEQRVVRPGFHGYGGRHL